MKLTYAAQPIVYIDSKLAFRYELLLRGWDEQEQRWRLPDSFEIPAEQQLALLDKALADLPVSNVSLNLSYAQFADERVADQFIAYAQAHPEIEQLTVELVAAPNMADIKQIGKRYREAGIALAIDDVGSDNLYDKVAPLLPYVDCVKFALQNLRATGETAHAEHDIAFWAKIARESGKLFTFEGVESSADVCLAKRLGITRAQGYYFGKPMATRDMPKRRYNQILENEHLHLQNG
ncbi:EAL domain-containing protein [Lacticaseibacillus zhaodongensis]|uniref:EAL domain-containing protein n=1 Tax=Lacticaseibacillus zhaodongensis TaxID=2668065 RepID=UPI0012D2DF9F